MQNGYAGTDVLEQALTLVWRRKWVGLLAFWITFPALVVAVLVLPKIYEADARVLIDRQQIPDSLVRSTVTSALDTRLAMIGEQILSRNRLIELAETYDLYPELRATRPMEEVARKMRSDIKLDFNGTSGRGMTTVSFGISFRGKDPQKLAVVTNALASLYVEENVKVREEQASGTSAFLRKQLEEMHRNLLAIEQKVSAFKSSHIGELPHQQEANLSTLEHLNTQLGVNGQSQLRVSERLNQLEGQLADALQVTEAAGGPTPPSQVAALERELNALLEQYSDKYPEVIRLKSELAALRAQQNPAIASIAPEGARILSLRAEIDRSNLELNTLQREADDLYGSIAVYQERVKKSPLLEQEFQVLMRDYDTTTELYQSLLQRQKEAELAENMERREKGEQFRIIERAIPPVSPAAPNRKRLLVVSLILSLGFAGGLMFLSERMDKSYHSLDDLRAEADVPVLAVVPPIITPSDKRRNVWRVVLRSSFAVATMTVAVAASYLLAKDNDTIVALLMR